MYGLLVAGGFVLAGGTTTVLADGLENGDFAKGKSRWTGDGQVMYLKPDGTISPADNSRSSLLPPVASAGTGTPAAAQKPTTTPIVEIKLKSTQFADFAQKFRTPKEMDVVNAEVTYKASADFKMNDKAIVFDREIGCKPGTFWNWSMLVHPKSDVVMRLDKRDNYLYKLDAASPGSDWKTMKVRWDNVGGGQDVTFHVVVTPGHGTLYIKSVTITP
jgi:hypothetical protein